MSRIKGLAAALTVVGVGAIATPAMAQDGPSMTLDPSSVEAAGEATLTAAGAGFTVADVFVVPCEGAKTLEDLVNAGDGACDLANLIPASVGDDGTFEIEITYEIPEGGMCFAAGDLAQTETTGACVSIAGAAAEGDAETGDTEEMVDEEADDDDAAEAGGDEDGADDDLASTGADTMTQLAIMGGLLAVGGAALVARRRIAVD